MWIIFTRVSRDKIFVPPGPVFSVVVVVIVFVPSSSPPPAAILVVLALALVRTVRLVVPAVLVPLLSFLLLLCFL